MKKKKQILDPRGQTNLIRIHPQKKGKYQGLILVAQTRFGFVLRKMSMDRARIRIRNSAEDSPGPAAGGPEPDEELGPEPDHDHDLDVKEGLGSQILVLI